MSKNIINLRACRSVKELALTAHETIGKLENALYEVLDVKSLEAAKELAADALDEDIDIYLEEDDLAELDFDSDDTFFWDEGEQDD